MTMGGSSNDAPSTGGRRSPLRSGAKVGSRVSLRSYPQWKTLKKKEVLHGYKAISDYGVIGDQRTCALVGLDGSIDWLCLPTFDSPSVFGALLDKKKGGSFRIHPESHEFESMQHYDGLTNILVTESRNDSGRMRITDFMPCFEVGRVKISTGEIHRRVSCLKGRMEARITVTPRPDYGSIVPRVEEQRGGGYSFLADTADDRRELALMTALHFDRDKGSVTKVLDLQEGDRFDFVLRYIGLESHRSLQTDTDIKFQETCAYWRKWARRVKYRGKWRDMVLRSALTLKLLVYAPTGAIVAAPTTSLPEEIHGVRNWDYRYSWIRDSSFVLWAFQSLGMTQTEDVYLDWLTSMFYLTGGDLQVMLGIGGERDLSERILDRLEGYKSSAPVRVGNAAWNQFQLDVYGILLDALWFSQKHMGEISLKIYEHLLKPIVAKVEQEWDKPDCGIWEVRGAQEHFVYSKVWCWVALDRAVRIAEELGMGEDRATWTALRDKIRLSIMERGWDGAVGSFVRSYGSKHLDAANLLMPQVRFIGANDPKMRATIDKTMGTLMTENKFVYRYLSDDGIPGEEGAFLICSFWLVSCLTMEGRLDEAEKLLDSLVECSNHLGLFSEEIDPKTGEMLGNFPQAFTHMGFVTATAALTKALAKRQREQQRR
jgi:GH15 family glucan-1,4-alpha-glucosidase